MMMMMRNIVRFETMSNLRYKTPKEIPVLLNNGSNCDYHFILRKTAEEFKRQFECFRENSEKCITFSVPLQKENENRCVKRVRIWRSSGPYFPAFGLIRRETMYLSVFSPNAEKHGPKKLRIQTLFMQ